jgi:hypothetical protein
LLHNISVFESLCTDLGYRVQKYSKYKDFITDLENDQLRRDGRRAASTYFDLIEHEIIEDHKKIQDLISSHNQISEQLETLIEKKYVYDKSSQLISGNKSYYQDQNNTVVIEEGNQASLNFLAGAINTLDEMKMKKMIHRASRGRAVVTFFDFLHNSGEFKLLKQDKEKEKNVLKKKIFTIFFQGGAENVLLQKLLKLCDVLGASRYNIPRREDMVSNMTDLHNEITEKKNFLKEVEGMVTKFLKEKLGNNVRLYIIFRNLDIANLSFISFILERRRFYTRI